MQEGSDRRRAASLAVVALVAVAIGAPTASALAAGGRVAADRMTARALVARAADRAAAKLQRPACRELLADFRDGAGRRLSEVLEERGLGAAEFLGSLRFLDGRGVPQCASGTWAAGANPGSPYVAICKETFARTQAEDPGLAANVLIHEMLHALGLGENPPTSEEITRRVTERCGP